MMFSPSHILAYVDPGAGLLAWQVVGAAVVGALFYVKKSRDYLLALIRKIFRIR
jgi:hypothetical protein